MVKAREDTSILTVAQQGGFDAFYRQHWAPMARLAWLLTGSREVAEDVVHDAFVKLLPRWSGLEVPNQYLYRMVVNGSHDHHHRRRKMAAKRAPNQSEPVWDPEVDEIWTLVSTLPDRQRRAIVLRYYADQTIDDIASALRCPQGTVKSLIHRGLARIEERIEQ